MTIWSYIYEDAEDYDSGRHQRYKCTPAQCWRTDAEAQRAAEADHAQGLKDLEPDYTDLEEELDRSPLQWSPCDLPAGHAWAAEDPNQPDNYYLIFPLELVEP